jgi:hypothetical protein
MQNHQLPTLILIKTALKQFKFCNMLHSVALLNIIILAHGQFRGKIKSSMSYKKLNSYSFHLDHPPPPQN